MVSGISLTQRVGGIDVVPVAYPVDLAGRRMIVGLASANELAGLDGLRPNGGGGYLRDDVATRLLLARCPATSSSTP